MTTIKNSLSDKITINEMGDIDSMSLYVGDVREAVRELKQWARDVVIKEFPDVNLDEVLQLQRDTIFKKIDEIFGKELTE